MPEGTLRAILKQAGIEPEQFLKKWPDNKGTKGRKAALLTSAATRRKVGGWGFCGLFQINSTLARFPLVFLSGQFSSQQLPREAR